MKVNIAKTEAVQEAIAAAQSARCSARTINTTDVYFVVRQIEDRLRTLLPKKHWKGLRFACDPNGQSFSGAYKGIPESTQFTLEWGGANWFLVDMHRSQCRGARSKIVPMNLSERSTEIMAHVQAHFPL